jgi:3-oxoacyl-[acyl-carrier-protein] synthase-3
MKDNKNNIYLHHPVFTLGSAATNLQQTANSGLLISDAALLADAGFLHHHKATDDETAYDLALHCGRQLQDDLSLSDVDVLCYATCLPVNANRGSWQDFSQSGDVKFLLDYAASHLQAALGMDQSIIVGVEQQACTGMLGAIRIGAMFLQTELSMNKVLCLTADRFPRGAKYEQAYNLISDGAAAVVLSREPIGFRLIACHQISNGAMAQASDDETVGFYFNYTQRLIQEILIKAAMTIEDLDWIVAQNTNSKAWKILSALLRFPAHKVLMPTLSEAGHVISGDNVINLLAADAANTFESGQKILMVMAGYGLNWQAVLLEKQ